MKTNQTNQHILKQLTPVQKPFLYTIRYRQRISSWST